MTFVNLSGLPGKTRQTVLFPFLSIIVLLTGCADKKCETVREDAVRLLEAYQTCETDEVCAVYDLFQLVGENNCLDTFQCSQALNATVDFAPFTKSAQSFVADFSSCNMCLTADCVPPDTFEAFCNTVTGLCELRPY